MKVLGAGYGTAVVLAAALYAVVGGVFTAVLTIWIGGAILTLAFAVWRTPVRAAPPVVADGSLDALLAEGRLDTAREPRARRVNASRRFERDE